jgi:hypothetical protein
VGVQWWRLSPELAIGGHGDGQVVRSIRSCMRENVEVMGSWS